MPGVADIPKLVISQLDDTKPRDILENFEGIVAAGTYNIPALYDGIAMDIDLFNSNVVAGNAVVILNNSKTFTIAPGQAARISPYPVDRIEVQIPGAAINLNMGVTGFTWEMIKVLTKWAG